MSENDPLVCENDRVDTDLGMVNLLLNEKLYLFTWAKNASDIFRDVTHRTIHQILPERLGKYGSLVSEIRWARFTPSRLPQVRLAPHPSQLPPCHPSICPPATVLHSSPHEGSIQASQHSSSSSNPSHSRRADVAYHLSLHSCPLPG